MLLKYFYDEKLAHASYMVGCQAVKEAVIVDPGRNVDPYIKAAAKEGMKLVGALETHIHADFVSGSRELAERIGVKMFLSDEGGSDWKYQHIDHLPHTLLKDGDIIKVGNITFEVIHTPGHTPESISFILIDEGVNADMPMGIFTGDFVFVGDVGRPDLLEKAAGVKGTSVTGAYEMFESLKHFKELPEFMQVWPAHGAGSACGKSLGAIPSSTVGYEKRFNWAMQDEEADRFVETLLEGQPEPPKYFASMKHVNKVGTTSVSELPSPAIIKSIEELETLIQEGAQVIDTRSSNEFSHSHLPGTINIPFNKSFTNWAGWIVDYRRPLYLLTEPETTEEVKIALQSIGVDQLESHMDVNKAIQSASMLESYKNIKSNEAEHLIKNREVAVLDVRSQSEWDAGHINGAKHIMLGNLLDRIEEVPLDIPILINCQAGGRSAIAASILQSKGVKDVLNLTGGYTDWQTEVKKQNV
ncbi:hydroxyacylglutathione hydrolase [Bacillus pakistanensis]|uniref:Hydroxyacylglutathione hydrolase n=1 Tax=Rossellomorea pakistanensis TaxID=992288 RepID=A0ABS2NDL4_9BACI|nr:MBL fold metallo-hydrolase [Bacillus pakistanensis]MBM7585944.1 hydroxyacylglutathione hydrolase [Bacillus pakistanensis]